MLNSLPNPTPDPVKKADVDVRKLMRWLAMMQGSERELGGFRGRTNKLVDGCYSWWIGGSFALVQALGPEHPRGGEGEQERATPPDEVPLEDAWDDVDGVPSTPSQRIVAQIG
jgi:protein farnesyltransferase subunit beta